MSVIVSDHVWSLLPASALRPVERLVLLKIADHAVRTGENAWPSVATIAAACGLKDRAVQTILRTLEAAGFIQVQTSATRYKPTTYRVVMGAAGAPFEAPAAEPVEPAMGAQPCTPDDDGRGAPGDGPGVHGTTARGAPLGTSGVHSHAPDPYVQPSVQPSKEPSAVKPAPVEQEHTVLHVDSPADTNGRNQGDAGTGWRFPGLFVSPKMHAIVADWIGGKAAALMDWAAFYGTSAAHYAEHGQPADWLKDLKARAKDAAEQRTARINREYREEKQRKQREESEAARIAHANRTPEQKEATARRWRETSAQLPGLIAERIARNERERAEKAAAAAREREARRAEIRARAPQDPDYAAKLAAAMEQARRAS